MSEINAEQSSPPKKWNWKTILSVFTSVCLIVIVGGRLLGEISISNPKNKVDQETTVVVDKKFPKDEINSAISLGLVKALDNAQKSAYYNLGQWEKEVMARVDHPFLDWYYDYFTQWEIGLKGIWINLTSSSDEEKAEKLIAEFQEEFTKQVLQPPTLQLQIERYTREAIEAYINTAEKALSEVKSQYKIPEPVWDEYLAGIATTIYYGNNEKQDLSLRAVQLGGVYTFAKIGSKIGVKISTKMATKIATKAGTKAAAKVTSKATTEALTELAEGGIIVGLQGAAWLLGPIADVGIIAYDVWDHNKTVKVERPIMRRNLDVYLSEVKEDLLNDAQNGLLSSIYRFHDGIVGSLRAQTSQT